MKKKEFEIDFVYADGVLYAGNVREKTAEVASGKEVLCFLQQLNGADIRYRVSCTAAL